MNKENLERTETRQHLIDAGAEVFAEHGFHKTTVREICKRAGVNIAAINYHFGDKKGLYTAIVQQGFLVANKEYSFTKGLVDRSNPKEKLLVFVRAFLRRMLCQEISAVYGKLMAREMFEPTGAMEAIYEQSIKPMALYLSSIVTDLLGSEATQEQIRNCAESIVGQCFFYKHAQRVIKYMHTDRVFDEKEIERLANHIVRFSLGGMKAELGKQEIQGEK